MDIAFVQNAQNDVHGDDCRKDQDRFIREGTEEGSSSALKRGLDAGRHVQFLFCSVDGVDRFTQSSAGRQVEGNGDHGELALMVQSERGVGRVEVCKSAERHLYAVGGFHINVFQRVGIL